MKTLRTLLALILGLAPLLFWLLVWRPAQARMAAHQARIAEARTRIQELPRYAPLSDEESAFLENSAAPWRQRIPLIRGDRDRLAHYHRVVTGVDQALRRGGLRIHGMRSSWDPIHASFTLDRELAGDPMASPPLENAQDGTLRAWVLEVQLDGPTGGLFTGLDRLGAISPLLEPVGLRWEATPERRAQALWLRNLVLVPADGPR
ncbi:MAG: hypothetical protein Q8K67_14455 [Geothrix sp.]|nr:hypothetical protein [Geothrix sp.]